MLSRGREMASRKAHNLEIGGSNPPPATNKIFNNSYDFGWVAQSVERGTHKPEVVGSKPTPATKIRIRVRGVARLTRLPVTEKIAGSNPVGPATKDISQEVFFVCTKTNASP